MRNYLDSIKTKFVIISLTAVILAIVNYIWGASSKAILFFLVSMTAAALIQLPVKGKLLNTIFFLWMALMAFLTFAIGQMTILKSFSLGLIHFKEAFLCVLIIFTLYAALTAICLRCQLSVFIGTALLELLYLIDYSVFTFQGNELTLSDFSKVVTALNVASSYDISFPPASIYLIEFIFVVWLLGFSLPPLEISSRLRARIILIGVTMTGMLGIITGCRFTEKYQFYNLGTRKNGFALSLVLQVSDYLSLKPAGYRSGEIAEIYDAMMQQENLQPRTGNAPNIIVVMNESYASFSEFANYRTDIDVSPFIDSLEKDTVKGYALSSVFGGNTANSEFEFLTGNTMAFLPAGSIPYVQYVKDDAYSILTPLKDKGYRCIAMHPYIDSGWNRQYVYREFGFDEIMFRDEFPQENLIRDLVSDQEMYEKIEEIYNKKEAGEKLFTFAISMQNHGSYDYSGDDFTPTVSLEGLTGKYPEAEQFLSLIHETDRATESLISYFRDYKEPALIVFFGDHLPRLENGFYEELYGGELSSLDQQEMLYKVPFFIWANYDIEEEYIECSSFNYLANYMFNAAGIELPAYNRILCNIEKVIPAVNSIGYLSSDGSFYKKNEVREEKADILRMYSVLEYNNVFDRHGRNTAVFPFISAQ